MFFIEWSHFFAITSIRRLIHGRWSKPRWLVQNWKRRLTLVRARRPNRMRLDLLTKSRMRLIVVWFGLLESKLYSQSDNYKKLLEYSNNKHKEP